MVNEKEIIFRGQSVPNPTSPDDSVGMWILSEFVKIDLLACVWHQAISVRNQIGECGSLKY